MPSWHSLTHNDMIAFKEDMGKGNGLRDQGKKRRRI